MRGIISRGILYPAPSPDLGVGNSGEAAQKAASQLADLVGRIRAEHPDADLSKAQELVPELHELSSQITELSSPLFTRTLAVVDGLVATYYSEQESPREM